MAPRRPTRPSGSTALGLALTAVALDLALTTGYIHLSLGGTLFTLNAGGYAALAAALALFAVPHPLTRRFAWLPRLALIGYTLTTIAAYLVLGPHFSLGWIAKAVEAGLVAVLAADLLRLYGSPGGLAREVIASVRAAAGPVATA